MIVLAIESSTLTASVAVVRDGTVVAAEDVPSPTHSDVLLSTIDRVMRSAALAPSALSVVAVGAGPGSFTGLRIGMATAKGIAFAAGIPLYTISSLAALADDAVRAGVTGLVVPVMDARRGEVYAGFYRDGVPISPDRVLSPVELVAAIGADPATVVGDALAMLTLAPPIMPRPDLRITPSAIAVAHLAATGPHPDSLSDGAPLYIRPAEAELKYPDGVPGALRKRD